MIAPPTIIAEQAGDDPVLAEVLSAQSAHKVAVIAQQIYSRFKQGLTTDERFAGMFFAVQMLSSTAVRATETICFAALKPGLLFEPGRASAGRVTVVDLGIPVEGDLAVYGVTDLVLPTRVADAHKWSAGCLVVGGSSGMVGAPLFAARAAFRTGAGMVVCGLPGAETAAAASGAGLDVD